jgi:hypothetical protein
VLWRDQPSAYFTNEWIHNGLILGVSGRRIMSPFRIRHFGPLDPEDLRVKMENLIQMDPSRRKIYERNRDQRVMVWPWYERGEAPGTIALQNAVLDALYLIRGAGRVLRRTVSHKRLLKADDGQT